jgi:hypothetical protein
MDSFGKNKYSAVNAVHILNAAGFKL